ncbi:MAG: MFS transporter [Alphaproteobacteria bacterium]|nr:MFS transporter [Alphaproteobacteria bacterium]
MAAVLPALLATLAMQAIVVIASLIVPITVQESGGALGFDPALVGYYTMVMWLGGMASALLSGGLIRRFGALRVCQATLVLAAIGALLTSVASLPAFALAGLLIGIAYGPANPAGSHLLAGLTPPHLRGRVFSVKQTGVPAGSTVAGLLVPAIALAWGWQAAGPVIALLCIAAMAAVQPWRARLDSDRNASAPTLVENPLAAIQQILALPPLRRAVLASAAFSMGQFCFTAFFVVYVMQRTNLGLAEAGLLFSLGFLASIAARIVWGCVADATSSRTALAALGIAMAVAALAATALEPSWPWLAIAGLSVIFGATAVGWNGVYLAEVARLAPGGDVGTATGGAMFFTLAGSAFGPALFGAVAGALGYNTAFVVMAAATGMTGLWVAFGREAPQRR